MKRRIGVLAACLATSWFDPQLDLAADGPDATVTVAEEPTESPPVRRDLSLAEDPRPWIPMRIRDMTLPNGIVMGFVPTPAARLGKGRWAIELQWGRANNFIATPDSIVTATPSLIEGMIVHPYSKETVQMFLRDSATLHESE